MHYPLKLCSLEKYGGSNLCDRQMRFFAKNVELVCTIFCRKYTAQKTKAKGIQYKNLRNQLLYVL